MTLRNETIKYSPLNQSVTRDGRTVQICIYKDVIDGWQLEVIDEYGNSTLWDALYESDEIALAEALMTIKIEGIEVLIGSPSPDELPPTRDQSLSAAELEELDNFLVRSNSDKTAMNVAMLEGFLACIAIGPSNVVLLDWLPWVWDRKDGEAEPSLDDVQGIRIISLIMRHYHSVMDVLGLHPESFEPMFLRDTRWSAADWCEGFRQGFRFNITGWRELASIHTEWLTPFLVPETDGVIAIDERADDAQNWFKEITSSLINIRQYWSNDGDSLLNRPLPGTAWPSPQRVTEPIVRESPKIGRNDPCPCNSGKKYKKCCGANAT